MQVRSTGKASQNLLVGTCAAVLLLAALVLVAGLALTRNDPWGENGNQLSSRFNYDIDQFKQVDPDLIAYAETDSYAASVQRAAALAVGPRDRCYVVGDGTAAVFDARGQLLDEFPVGGTATCIAVGSVDHAFPGRIYVGVADHVEVYSPEGTETARWREGFDNKSVLTSVAVADEDVFVADAGNRLVLRFSSEGELLARIGEIDPDRGVRGFVVPSPHFDVAATADGLLRIANPGARRVETFSVDGDYMGAWGRASAEIDGFFGCCNPANFTVLSDMRFVTVEKGIPRVKVYAKDGTFQSVVAPPAALVPTATADQDTRDEHQLRVFDVAVDSHDRILVLDPTSGRVRVFDAIEDEPQVQEDDDETT
jgi:hypothetical protein